MDTAAHPLPFEQAYSYGGYCMQLDETHLILGASFLPQREDDEVNEEDHVHNFNLIHSVFPEYAQGLPPVSTWSGRAGVRAQSPDYFPLVVHQLHNPGYIRLQDWVQKGLCFPHSVAKYLPHRF